MPTGIELPSPLAQQKVQHMKTQSDYAYQQLVQANADRVATGMFSLLDRLQNIERDGEKIAAAALISVLAAERFGVDPHEAIKVARTILAKDNFYARGQQFAAVREYLKQEVRA